MKTTAPVPVISAWSGRRTHAEPHYQCVIEPVMRNNTGVLISHMSPQVFLVLAGMYFVLLHQSKRMFQNERLAELKLPKE